MNEKPRQLAGQFLWLARRCRNTVSDVGRALIISENLNRCRLFKRKA